jgi:hypothetical protein
LIARFFGLGEVRQSRNLGQPNLRQLAQCPGYHFKQGTEDGGEITLQQMLHEWTMHDLGHIRQIAELVRARKHLQAAGKLGDSYRLKP